jgi:hypothetical protein
LDKGNAKRCCCVQSGCVNRKTTIVNAGPRRTLLVEELHFPSGCLDIWISTMFRDSQHDRHTTMAMVACALLCYDGSYWNILVPSIAAVSQARQLHIRRGIVSSALRTRVLYATVVSAYASSAVTLAVCCGQLLSLCVRSCATTGEIELSPDRHASIGRAPVVTRSMSGVSLAVHVVASGRSQRRWDPQDRGRLEEVRARCTTGIVNY